jgi:hypothetical protein
MSSRIWIGVIFLALTACKHSKSVDDGASAEAASGKTYPSDTIACRKSNGTL